MTSDPHQQSALIKSKARELGFDLCGIAPVDPSSYRDYFRRWIEAGLHGDMTYLAERVDERTDLRTYFPPANSVVCLAMNYHVPLEQPLAGHGKIARYALGIDYHEHIQDRVKILADWMRATWPGTQTKIGVDTAPIMEKELAVRAGVGWMGKNTCVIHPRVGSWLLLAEIVTSLDLPTDSPMLDRCGRCTRCIDACPTDAITAPYQLDGTRCISYWTLETERQPPPDLQPHMQNWLAGCDVCQDVCPFNARAPIATLTDLQPRIPTGSIDAISILNWTKDDYNETFRRSTIKRVKLPQLKRNAAVVVKNLSSSLL